MRDPRVIVLRSAIVPAVLGWCAIPARLAGWQTPSTKDL